MKSVVAIGSLIALMWASLILVLVFIERTLLNAPLPSAWRSIAGISLYLIWALAWLLAVLKISRALIGRMPYPSGREGDPARV